VALRSRCRAGFGRAGRERLDNRRFVKVPRGSGSVTMGREQVW
jgi:hypothetical protein